MMITTLVFGRIYSKVLLAHNRLMADVGSSVFGVPKPNGDDSIKTGGQIDLLIDRADKTITVCEMKYSDGEYEIDKAYDKHVQDRLRLFKDVEKTTKSLQVAYITPHGLYNNMYARKVNKQITADHLFL